MLIGSSIQGIINKYQNGMPKLVRKAVNIALMTKTDLTFLAFSLRYAVFAVDFCFHCKFLSTRSDFQVKFDSGVIFLDQSQFFATHSNQ